jgi:hypothetical protein
VINTVCRKADGFLAQRDVVFPFSPFPLVQRLYICNVSDSVNVLTSPRNIPPINTADYAQLAATRSSPSALLICQEPSQPP